MTAGLREPRALVRRMRRGLCIFALVPRRRDHARIGKAPLDADLELTSQACWCQGSHYCGSLVLSVLEYWTPARLDTTVTSQEHLGIRVSQSTHHR